MKYFEVMHVRTQMDVMMKTVMTQAREQVAESFAKLEPDASEKVKKQVDASITEMYEVIQKDFSTEDLLQDLVPVYQRHITRTDLQQIVDFYQSPVGQRFLNQMPSLTTDAMQAMKGRSQKMMDDILAKVKQRADAIKAEQEKDANQ